MPARRRVNTLDKTRSSGDRFAYTIDFNNVDADRKNHERSPGSNVQSPSETDEPLADSGFFGENEMA